MSQHFNTGPGFPQTREEVLALTNDELVAFMINCDVDPGDPRQCFACLAHAVYEDRMLQSIGPPPAPDLPAWVGPIEMILEEWDEDVYPRGTRVQVIRTP